MKNPSYVPLWPPYGSLAEKPPTAGRHPLLPSEYLTDLWQRNSPFPVSVRHLYILHNFLCMPIVCKNANIRFFPAMLLPVDDKNVWPALPPGNVVPAGYPTRLLQCWRHSSTNLRCGIWKNECFSHFETWVFSSALQMPVSVFPEAVVHSPVRTDELPALEVYENFSPSHSTSDNKSLYPSFICPAVSFSYQNTFRCTLILKKQYYSATSQKLVLSSPFTFISGICHIIF